MRVARPRDPGLNAATLNVSEFISASEPRFTSRDYGVKIRVAYVHHCIGPG